MASATEKDAVAPRTDRRKRYHIDAIARGLSVLTSFNSEMPTQSLSEIANAVGLSPSSVLRQINTLRDHGFLEEIVDIGHYQPSLAALKVGHVALASSPLRTCAVSTMRRLHDVTNETIHLAVILEDGVYHIERFERQDAHTLKIRRGSRFPVHCTSSGRVMLAYMPDEERRRWLDQIDIRPLTPYTITDRAALEDELKRIRENGYAISDQEVFLNLRVTSAPIFDDSGYPVASVNVRIPSSRMSVEETTRQHVPLVIGAAAEISARLRTLRADAGDEQPQLADYRPDQPEFPEAHPSAAKSRYHVEALSKGLAVLRLFSSASPKLMLNEISKRTEMSPSTAFRVVTTLADLGFLSPAPEGGAYMPDLNALRLGFAAMTSVDLADGARAGLLKLHNSVQGVVSLCVRAGDEIIDRLSFRHYDLLPHQRQNRLLHCTPGGKVIIAYMPAEERDRILGDGAIQRTGPRTVSSRAELEGQLATIRSEGMAIVDEEEAPGMRGVAAPVFDQDGRCVAAITANVSTTRLSLEDLRTKVSPKVRAAAGDLSDWIYYTNPKQSCVLNTTMESA